MYNDFFMIIFFRNLFVQFFSIFTHGNSEKNKKFSFLENNFLIVFTVFSASLRRSFLSIRSFVSECIVKWCRGVVVITTAQLHSTKPELRLCAGSNPAHGVSEIRDGEDLWQWTRLEIRLYHKNNSSSSSSSSQVYFFNTSSRLCNIILLLAPIKLFTVTLSFYVPFPCFPFNS